MQRRVDARPNPQRKESGPRAARRIDEIGKITLAAAKRREAATDVKKFSQVTASGRNRVRQQR
jgi:hypothetical protein